MNVLQATTWIAIWSTAMIGLPMAAFAQGQAILINNAGFESTVLNCAGGPGCYALYVIPGWTVIGELATFKPSTGPGGIFPGGIPEGSNVAALGDAIAPGVITQDLGFAPLANTTYTLTVSVGQRADSPLTAYAVELLVGTTSVASDTALRPAPGTFALDTVTYKSGSSPGAGHLFIRLSGSGGGQAEFDRVALNAASSVPPSITAGGIVPVFSSSPVIQPGSWVSIYGSNFAGATIVWNGNFPTSLGGTSVTINQKPGYLWYVSPTQINLQAPDDTATGTVIVSVTTPAGSASSTVTLAPYDPSFSLFNNKYAAAIALTPGSAGNSGAGYDYIGPTGGLPFSSRPVKAGETLLLYGVGFGPTNPAVPAGQAFSGAAPSVVLPRITIGGVPATVSSAAQLAIAAVLD